MSKLSSTIKNKSKKTGREGREQRPSIRDIPTWDGSLVIRDGSSRSRQPEPSSG
jgi:hypothetical protein